MRSVILLLAVACAPTVVPSVMPPAPKFGSWPGCYALRLDAPRSYPDSQAGVMPLPPAIVRLDTTRALMAEDSVGGGLEPGLATSGGRRDAPPYWKRLGPHWVMLVWPNEPYDLRILLEQRPYDVSGLSLSDPDGRYKLSGVSAQRVSCVRLAPPVR